MKVDKVSRKERVTKIGDSFSKTLINIIQDICVNQVKSNVSEKIKDLKDKEKEIETKLKKFDMILENSENIEKSIKDSIEKIKSENEEKRIKLLEILGSEL